MSDDDNRDDSAPEGFADKTSVVPSDTFRLRMEEADREPACLVMLVGPPALIGKQWKITSSDLVVGRAVNSHIYIDDKSVSKSHIKVTLDGFNVSVIDLESTNKTIVNGNVIPPLVPVGLKNNDQIRCGNIILKFLEEGNIETVSAQDTYDRSQKDPLTGIHNKGALIDYGPEALKRAELLQFPLSVIVFDIDHFKKINDTYGHAAGDFILKELAQIITHKMIRTDDFFARFGGEEFVVILHGNPLDRSVEIAERIRQMVESHKFVFQGKHIPVTISLGVTTRTPEIAEWDTLFERADKALYQSKESGRNRVSHL